MNSYIILLIFSIKFHYYIFQQIVGDQNSAPVILGIENTELEKALQIFPKLHSALFPALAKESAQNDVTIYQLLMVFH